MRRCDNVKRCVPEIRNSRSKVRNVISLEQVTQLDQYVHSKRMSRYACLCMCKDGRVER